jgi:hypothetical protein
MRLGRLFTVDANTPSQKVNGVAMRGSNASVARRGTVFEGGYPRCDRFVELFLLEPFDAAKRSKKAAEHCLGEHAISQRRFGQPAQISDLISDLAFVHFESPPRPDLQNGRAMTTGATDVDRRPAICLVTKREFTAPVDVFAVVQPRVAGHA